MKITVWGLCLSVYALTLLSACASTSGGTEARLSLQDAIEQSAKSIAEELPTGSRVAIVAFESAMSIGKFLVATIVITGELINI